MDLNIVREGGYRIEGFFLIYFIIFQSVGGEGGIRTLGLLLLFNRLVANAGRGLSDFVPYSPSIYGGPAFSP
jgi:hypothetical protein